MTTPVSRKLLRWAILGGVAALVTAGPNFAMAQVSCYVKRCLVYPDGSAICERTPVDCSTIRL